MDYLRLCAVTLLTLSTARCAVAVAPQGPPESPVPDAGTPDARETPPTAAPRPIAPLSSAEVTTHRPTLRWALGAGARGAHVRLCDDRALTRDCQELDATGSSLRVPSALRVGVHYWRLRDADDASATGPVWQFRVTARDTAVDTSWGSSLDVNADGFADHLSVTRLRRREASLALYLGGPGGLLAEPSRVLPTTGSSSDGSPVATRAGDVDGDGYPDVVVSAGPAVRVYRGGPAGLDRPFELAITRGAEESACAGPGDIDGDGYADLVVGLPATPGRQTRLNVYPGGAAGPRSEPYVVSTFATTAITVSPAGDVNGDGLADLLVANATELDGRVFLYLGTPDGLSRLPAVTLFEGDPRAREFGSYVGGASDVNGDGFADVFVASRSVVEGAGPWPGSTGGALTLYLGGALDGDAPTLRVVRGAALGAPPVAQRGPELGGDLDGDGFDDVVLVGSDASGGDAVFVLRGGRDVPGSARFVALPAVAAGEGDGVWTALAVGDTNDDGFDELLLGRWSLSSVHTYVFHGGSEGLATPTRALVTGTTSEREPFVGLDFVR